MKKIMQLYHFIQEMNSGIIYLETQESSNKSITPREENVWI